MALANDKPTAAKKIVCDNCDNEGAAQSRCNECGVFLCRFCTKSHRRSRSTKQHKLLTMEELKSNTSLQNIAEKMKCSKHKDEIIKLFCKTCQTTICRDCTIVDHRQHDYGFVEEVAVKEKQLLQRNLNDVKQKKAKVLQGIDNLKKFNQLLDEKKESTVSEIDRHFDELAKAVESQKRQMVEKSTSLTNSKKKQINAQIEAFEIALASCESSIEFTEQAFKNGYDVQILSMEKYILQSLEQLKTFDDQTKPCVTEDMMFMIPSSVQETKEKLFNKYDVHIAVACPESCKASFNEFERVFDPGKQYSITLTCYDKDHQKLKYGGQDIKPSFSGMEVTEVTVTDMKDGSFIIRFCPRQGGVLKFEVSINGMPAPSCSLTQDVHWVLSDVYGKGVITDSGRRMNGVGRDGEYCYRVGECYFESGVYSWEVQLSASGLGSRRSYSGEVGVIDCDEINGNIKNSKKKWAYRWSVNVGWGCSPIIFLNLDMYKKTLKIDTLNAGGNYLKYCTAQNCQISARRVSPFISCDSRFVSLTIRM